ncbi:hypothetical protein FHL15_008070 [Xylaria flabelliformis]|uniref:F-box domain-containing protein n=1 Tax=Xylaria flabelliformis TaxID=2512241 RepID=A0A553HT04_9PEZI|nr:hypothetical protein FHL15_008070 [Xylaria flabelliformis]
MPTPILYQDKFGKVKVNLKAKLSRGTSVFRETSLTPSVLDHGYYSSRLQIAAPITGWGRLASLPNELIYMILEQCPMETLLSIMLVSRSALDFVLRLFGFDRILATLLIHIKAIRYLPSALDNFLTAMKGRTYASLNVLTTPRSCFSCGCDVVNIPGRPFPRSFVVCAECCIELGSVRILDSTRYRRVMASIDTMPPIRARL